MARPSARLVLALRETHARLSAPATRYEWSHFGHCNCGHLAQTITGKSARAIYDAAFHRPGDWGEQAAAIQLAAPDFGDRPALDEGAYEPEPRELCGVTGSPLEHILGAMYALGLDQRDIDQLEDLSNEEVLRRLGAVGTELTRNDRDDVVRYLGAWADALEARLSPRERTALEDATSDDLPVAAEE